MSNTGHRRYLWDLPRNGFGVGWLAEVDMLDEFLAAVG